MRYKRILVTGGAGFIGSAFIRYGLSRLPCESLTNLDLLTYASDLKSLETVAEDPRYLFVEGDICDEELVERLCVAHRIDAIVHFAAETHVDRSIQEPTTFLYTNVAGTVALLEVVRRHPHIHFHHVSTDEVYGSLEEGCFTENSPYRPNSPYAASKAAADHFVRAYAHTYQLSTTLSHCSNNYGPFQNGEKFIPRMISCCLDKQPLPIYGTGANVRDWLYVDDHAEALWMILEKGKRGDVFDIGGDCEKQNLELLKELIPIVADASGEDPESYRSLITFVPDRPGHDLRYAIDCTKIKKELGWKPRHSFSEGLKITVDWLMRC